MTFWEMFNNHPFYGCVVAIFAVIIGGLTAENLLNTISAVLRARWGGCDCVPCDREHVEEEEPETESSGVAKEKK